MMRGAMLLACLLLVISAAGRRQWLYVVAWCAYAAVGWFLLAPDPAVAS